jgi:hypothetical protein
MNYVTLNLGLGGLFTRITPKQAIEGYNSPFLEVLKNTPVYMGGDATINPFISIDNAITNPVNNSISMMTGQTNYTLTRQYGLWMD